MALWDFSSSPFVCVCVCVRGTAFMLRSAPASVLFVSAYGSTVHPPQVEGENVTWYKRFPCLLLGTHKPFLGRFAAKILLTGENSSFLPGASPFKTAAWALQANVTTPQHRHVQVDNDK